MRFDAIAAPNPEAWLTLDGTERVDRVFAGTLPIVWTKGSTRPQYRRFSCEYVNCRWPSLSLRAIGIRLAA
jgi:hypothetical protein